jgi:hypothetical protein
MSKLYNGSICLTDIPKIKINVGKNGKKYLSVNVWINDSVDQFGNIGSIQVSLPKAERDAGAKGAYIGNFKEPQAAQNAHASTSDLTYLPWD